MAKILNPSAVRPTQGAPQWTSCCCRMRSVLHKPILAICHGVQTLNVWWNGSLVQDLKTEVNHRPGREVMEAHPVRIAAQSRLAGLLPEGGAAAVQVNSSHHQAIRAAGDNLLVSAVSPVDGVIEAVELDSAEHFVVGVQWHPERTYSVSPIFAGDFCGICEGCQQLGAATDR